MRQEPGWLGGPQHGSRDRPHWGSTGGGGTDDSKGVGCNQFVCRQCTKVAAPQKEGAASSSVCRPGSEDAPASRQPRRPRCCAVQHCPARLGLSAAGAAAQKAAQLGCTGGV